MLEATTRHYRVVCSCNNGSPFYEGTESATAERMIRSLRNIEGHDLRIEWADVPAIEWTRVPLVYEGLPSQSSDTIEP